MYADKPSSEFCSQYLAPAPNPNLDTVLRSSSGLHATGQPVLVWTSHIQSGLHAVISLDSPLHEATNRLDNHILCNVAVSRQNSILATPLLVKPLCSEHVTLLLL